MADQPSTVKNDVKIAGLTLGGFKGLCSPLKPSAKWKGREVSWIRKTGDCLAYFFANLKVFFVRLGHFLANGDWMHDKQLAKELYEEVGSYQISADELHLATEMFGSLKIRLGEKHKLAEKVARALEHQACELSKPAKPWSFQMIPGTRIPIPPPPPFDFPAELERFDKVNVQNRNQFGLPPEKNSIIKDLTVTFALQKAAEAAASAAAAADSQEEPVPPDEEGICSIFEKCHRDICSIHFQPPRTVRRYFTAVAYVKAMQAQLLDGFKALGKELSEAKRLYEVSTNPEELPNLEAKITSLQARREAITRGNQLLYPFILPLEERLSDYLAEYAPQQTTPPDGSCLFWAISFGLHPSIPADERKERLKGKVKQYRRLVAKYMVENPKLSIGTNTIIETVQADVWKESRFQRKLVELAKKCPDVNQVLKWLDKCKLSFIEKHRNFIVEKFRDSGKKDFQGLWDAAYAFAEEQNIADSPEVKEILKIQLEIYARVIEKTSMWGGNIELHALSKALGISIISTTWSPTRPGRRTLSTVSAALLLSGRNRASTVVIHYDGCSHYQSCVDLTAAGPLGGRTRSASA